MAAEEITVFAAARFRAALDEIATQWEERSGEEVALTYAGTGQLVQQILQGAPADVFISGSQDWMDELQVEGRIDKDSRRDLLGNPLVLLAHGEAEPVAVGPGLDLVGLLDGGRLAMVLDDSLSVGVHSRRALTSLGLWEGVEPAVIQAESPQDVVELVARGRASLGIVYATHAVAAEAAGDDVSVVGTFPENSHPPMIYPAALLARRLDKGAEFLDFLSSHEARMVFEGHGFTVLAGREE